MYTLLNLIKYDDEVILVDVSRLISSLLISRLDRIREDILYEPYLWEFILSACIHKYVGCMYRVVGYLSLVRLGCLFMAIATNRTPTDMDMARH